MSINRLLESSNLEPAEREVLNLAFIRALRLLHLVDRNDPICEIVARKIIEIGATGAGDPVVISEIAVTQLADFLDNRMGRHAAVDGEIKIMPIRVLLTIERHAKRHAAT